MKSLPRDRYGANFIDHDKPPSLSNIEVSITIISVIRKYLIFKLHINAQHKKQ